MTRPSTPHGPRRDGLHFAAGGLRTGENRSLTQPGSADDGGPAAWGYDLIGRLTSYTSPFRLTPGDTAEPLTTYTLDDGANIVSEATTVAGVSRASSTAAYPNGRLASRTTTPDPVTAPGIGPSTTTFGYSPLGEETSRILTGPGAGTTTTSYDPAGHVNVVDDQRPAGVDVDYTYDGTNHLLARQQLNPPGPTTLYFTWGMGQGLAEETDGAGTTKVAYLNDGAGGTIAQQSAAGTWTWLADDSDANLATQAADNGSVVEQHPFDPYGRPESAGMSKAAGAPGSSLGFQATLTDPTTKAVLLGPRQYDPATARFASADSFVSSAAELGLATDPLTSNRYIFAAANPVAFYEDGHFGFVKHWRRYLARARTSLFQRISSSLTGGGFPGGRLSPGSLTTGGPLLPAGGIIISTGLATTSVLPGGDGGNLWTDQPSPGSGVRLGPELIYDSAGDEDDQPDHDDGFIDNPDSLRGLTPKEVEGRIPGRWIRDPSQKGGGTRYRDPTRPGVQVIIEPGGNTASDPLHQGPYARVSDGRGPPQRIPLAGDPALPK